MVVPGSKASRSLPTDLRFSGGHPIKAHRDIFVLSRSSDFPVGLQVRHAVLSTKAVRVGTCGKVGRLI